MSTVKGVVLFPGAGSSSTHSSLLAMENALSPIPVARVDFPYRKAGKSFPDRAPILVQCVKDEVRAFAESLGVATTEVVIGGRSMGGRMCSMAATDENDPLHVAGLVLVSYPLHPPKKPDKLRIEHLPRLATQTVCISGTRDEFGTPDELTSAFSVAPGDVQWRWIENGRHELARRDDLVAEVAAEWITAL